MPKARNIKLRLACLEQWKAQWIKSKPKHAQVDATTGKTVNVSEKVFTKHNRNHRTR